MKFLILMVACMNPATIGCSLHKAIYLYTIYLTHWFSQENLSKYENSTSFHCKLQAETDSTKALPCDSYLCKGEIYFLHSL